MFFRVVQHITGACCSPASWAVAGVVFKKMTAPFAMQWLNPTLLSRVARSHLGRRME